AAFFYQMTQRHSSAVAGQINVMNATQAVQLAVLGLFVGLLVYTGLERAIAMDRLLRKPLAINFFDTRNLAPLNHLSLQISFALIGLVSLPILLFGGAVLVVAVQGLIYIVGALSALVAFALPFWGVHQQMVTARDKELEKIEPRLNALYRQLLDQTDRAPVGEINALAQYRAILKTAPVWPYQSVRVVAQAAIPILLPLASYLIQQRVAPLISDWLR
ncbi:MAG: hypothetical protein L0Y55_13430, partial [Anaerolineales bacterium]|nr:hypothetical protein [Anaerolineales bacterium]